jgi:hypothetical protein
MFPLLTTAFARRLSPFSATVSLQNRRLISVGSVRRAWAHLHVHVERVVRWRFSDNARQLRAGTLGEIACRIGGL